MKKITSYLLSSFFLLGIPLSATLVSKQNDSQEIQNHVSLHNDSSTSFLKDVEHDLVAVEADIYKVEYLTNIAPQDFEEKQNVTLEDLEEISRRLLGGLSTILRVSISEEIALSRAKKDLKEKINKNQKYLEDKSYPIPQKEATEKVPKMRMLTEEELLFLSMQINSLKNEQEYIDFSLQKAKKKKVQINPTVQELTSFRILMLLHDEITSSEQSTWKRFKKNQSRCTRQQKENSVLGGLSSSIGNRCNKLGKQILFGIISYSDKDKSIRLTVEQLIKEELFPREYAFFGLSRKSQILQEKVYKERIQKLSEEIRKLHSEAKKLPNNPVEKFTKNFKNILQKMEPWYRLIIQETLQELKKSKINKERTLHYSQELDRENECKQAYSNAAASISSAENAKLVIAKRQQSLIQKQQSLLKYRAKITQYKRSLSVSKKANLQVLNEKDTYNKTQLGLIQAIHQISWEVKILQQQLQNATALKEELEEIKHQEEEEASKKDSKSSELVNAFIAVGAIASFPVTTAVIATTVVVGGGAVLLTGTGLVVASALTDGAILQEQVLCYRDKYYHLEDLSRNFSNTFKDEDPLTIEFKEEATTVIGQVQEIEKNAKKNSNLSETSKNAIEAYKEDIKPLSLDEIQDQYTKLIKDRMIFLKEYDTLLQDKIHYHRSFSKSIKSEINEDEDNKEAEEDYALIQSLHVLAEHLQILRNKIQMECLSLPVEKKTLSEEMPDFYQAFDFTLYKNAYTHKELKNAKEKMSQKQKKIFEKSNKFKNQIEGIQAKMHGNIIIANTISIRKLLDTQSKVLASNQSTCGLEIDLLQIRIDQIEHTLYQRQQLALLLGTSTRLGIGLAVSFLIVTPAGPVAVILVPAAVAMVTTGISKGVEDLTMNGGSFSGAKEDFCSKETVKQIVISGATASITNLPAPKKIFDPEKGKMVTKYFGKSLGARLKEWLKKVEPASWEDSIPTSALLTFSETFVDNIINAFVGEGVSSLVDKADSFISETKPTNDSNDIGIFSQDPSNPNYHTSHQKHSLKSRLTSLAFDAGIQTAIKPITSKVGACYQQSKNINGGKATLESYMAHKGAHFLIGGTMGALQQASQNFTQAQNIEDQYQQGNLSEKEYMAMIRQTQKSSSLMKSFLIGGASAATAEVVSEANQNCFHKLFQSEEQQEKLKQTSATLGKMAGTTMGYALGDIERGKMTAFNAIDNNFLQTSKQNIVCIDEINEEIEKAYLQGGEKALTDLFIEKDFITQQEDGTFYCHRTQESHSDPTQLLRGAIHKDNALNRLMHNLIPTTNTHIRNIQNTSNRKNLKTAKKQAYDDIKQNSEPSYHAWRDRNVSHIEKELIETEMKGLTKEYKKKINQAYKKQIPTKRKRKKNVTKRSQQTCQNPTSKDDYHSLLKKVENNEEFQQKRKEVLRQQLKQEKLETEINKLGDPEASRRSSIPFQFGREKELQQEKIKNSEDLKSAKKDFQTDPLYQEVLLKGVETQLEQEDIYRKKDGLLGVFGLPVGPTGTIMDISEEEKEKHKQYDEQIKKRGRRKHKLRKALLREDSPSNWKMAGAFLKGGVKSGVDFVKLPLDMACLAGKLAKNTLKSVYYLRDEFGICNTISGAKELINHLCNDGKYEWESPEQYQERLRVARIARQRQKAYEKFHNAQDYHLGNAEIAGYWTTEVALFIFGGEIIKGGSNIAKGITRAHKVEEAAHLLRQGQKAQKVAHEADTLQKAAKMTQGTEKVLHEAQTAQKIVSLEQRTRKSTQAAKTLQESKAAKHAIAAEEKARKGMQAFEKVKLIEGSKKMHKHHLLPQQFKKWFKKRGIDIDRYTVSISQRMHLKGVHGKGIEKMPGQWNNVWAKFIANNPNATASEIFYQAEIMRAKYGLEYLTYLPYK